MSLSVEGVVAGYYGDIDVLHDVSMKAEKHKTTVIIGPNGAGKSTLLKVICGFLKPRRGKIVFDGVDITGREPSSLVNLGIAYVPQERTIFPSLTVEENLELGAWSIRRDKAAVEEAVREVYELFPMLKEKRGSKARTLSGGMQRMIEIGRALMSKPKLILLDEPTAMLAPKIAREIYEVIKSLRITIVLVDQNVRQAIEVSDYVYVLEMGRNKVEGPREDFEKGLIEVVKDWLIV